MAEINILVAVDGAKIQEQVSDGKLNAGSKDSPTNLGAWSDSDVYIAMITQHQYTSNDKGGSELTVKANSGDVVKWAMTTFGGNADYTAFIYAGDFNPAANITSLNTFNEAVSEYMPDSSGTVTLFHNHNYAGLCNVLQPGQQIQYTMSFQLVDNSNGKTVGYFLWDPFINVSN